MAKRLAVARMFCGLKYAHSMSTSSVSSPISLFSPIMPASATPLVSSAINSASVDNSCSFSSSVVNFYIGRVAGDDDRLVGALFFVSR